MACFDRSSYSILRGRGPREIVLKDSVLSASSSWGGFYVLFLKYDSLGCNALPGTIRSSEKGFTELTDLPSCSKILRDKIISEAGKPTNFPSTGAASEHGTSLCKLQQ